MALRQVLAAVILAIAVAAPPALAAPAKAARAAEPGRELLTLAAADGFQVPAILTLPAGSLSGGAMIVQLPDGPGGSVVNAAEPARFVAAGLARRGYPCLAVETRHSSQYPSSRFDEAFADVKAAVDFAAARGFSGVILEGAGLGALLATRYAAEAGDARVKGVIALAPSPDLAATWRAKVGEETYARTVERATRAGSDGAAGFIDLGEGVIFTPAAFLDWYGPGAKTSMAAAVAALDRPLLLLAGGDDPTVTPGRLERLAAQARKGTVKSYPGAGHDLARASADIVADSARWLAEIGVPPLAAVTTTIVDTVARDGTVLSGLLYAPSEAPPSARPIFLLVHGFTGDVTRSAAHWLAVRLARHGYAALAVRTRGSGLRNTVTTRLEDVPQDLAAWSTWLGAHGHGRAIAVGQGIGGLWLSLYLSESQDRRFRGAVYLSPARDLPALARRAMGEEGYARAVQEAEAAVKAGRGATTLINLPFPQAVFEDDPRQPMYLAPAAGGMTYYYANAFLSYWGPESAAVHRERVAEMKIPVLALGGSRDPMMQGGWLLQFIRAAGGPSASIFYGGPTGAPASFDGYEGRVADDIVGWAERIP